MSWLWDSNPLPSDFVFLPEKWQNVWMCFCFDRLRDWISSELISNRFWFSKACKDQRVMEQLRFRSETNRKKSLIFFPPPWNSIDLVQRKYVFKSLPSNNYGYFSTKQLTNHATQYLEFCTVTVLHSCTVIQLRSCVTSLLHLYTRSQQHCCTFSCWTAILLQFCNVLLLHCCTIVLLCHVPCLDTLWRKKQTKIRIILPTYIMANNVRSHCLRNLEHWRIFIRLIFIRRISALAITRSTLWRSHDAGECSQPRVQFLLSFY